MNLSKQFKIALLILALPTTILAQPLTEVTIHGVVTDSLSGQPLEGVLVEAINEADTTERASGVTDNNGQYTINLTTRMDETILPSEFCLFQNYPNPFNPSTIIQFEVPRSSKVQLIIYNTLGQKIRTLLNQRLDRDSYSVEWDGSNDAGRGVAAGIYFYQLRTSDYLETKKMVLLDGMVGGRSEFSSASLRKTNKFQKPEGYLFTVRANSPQIKPFEKSHIAVFPSSTQFDVAVQRLPRVLNRKLIMVSEPGASSKVYVSGLPGAVIAGFNGELTVTVTNRRIGIEASTPVNQDGSLPLMRLAAIVGDRLTMKLKRDGQSTGAPEDFIVPENKAPSVLKSKPTNGDKDIIIDAIIYVHFSEPIETSTVNDSSFYLADSFGTKVPGTIGFLSDTVATLDPVDPLAYSTQYTITVTTDVADLDSLHLDSLYTATFKTEAQPARVINVPADAISIQGGIDLAIDGDTVLVAGGTYIENINFKGKAIIVASHLLMDGDKSHISKTIIDGSQPSHADSGSVVFFVSGEDTTSVLYGFTITHGSGTITETLYYWYYGSTKVPIRIGGGIFCYNSGAGISHNKIINNHIPNYEFSAGGGIAGYPVGSAANVKINSNQIVYNKISGGEASGAAISLRCNGFIIDNDISFSTTNASYDGSGAVDCFSLDTIPRIVVIKNNRITYNMCDGYQKSQGGGLFIHDGMNASVIANLISYNSLTTKGESRGAGICMFEMTGISFIDRNTISHNHAQGSYGYGGGISLYEKRGDAGTTSIMNNVIYDNSATEGGGIYSMNNKANIINNTIVNNAASWGGGIWTIDNASTILLNSILWGNQTMDLQISGNPLVAYSNIQDSVWVGENNISVDPLFADTLFHLSNSSLCIGAGIDSIQFGGVWYAAPPNDRGGNQRPNPSGSMPDIGAWESSFIEP